MCRISNLPDGCNRLDEPWSRDYITGYEDEYQEHVTWEEYVLESINDANEFSLADLGLKTTFVKWYEDEIEGDKKMQTEIKIEAQVLHRKKVPVDDVNIIEWCVDEKNKGMTCIGCGQCEEIVCFTPEGALSGKETVIFDIEENNILKRLKAEHQAQAGEISWWEIYSTQQEVDAAVARMKRAHRTKIVKIEMDIVIN